MHGKTVHKREIHLNVWRKPNSNRTFSMCECTKGFKVFELSLSSVTYNRIWVLRVHVCMSVYRSLIVLVCFPTLSHSLSLSQINIIVVHMKSNAGGALICYVHSSVYHILCACWVCACVSVIFTMSVHVFYYQSNFVT